MTYYDYDIGIIGGGAAGLTVTSGAAQLGARTLLIEKEAVLGGDCLHFGCVPSKTLIKSAHVYHLMKNAVRFGLPQPNVPPVDFKAIAARIGAVIDTIQQHDSVKRFCRLGAAVAFGRPEFTDEHGLMLDDKLISAKTWVIASGSAPAIPPIPGLAESGYLTNRDIFSLRRLPQKMVFLGGGPIGVEMAQAFNRLGAQVCIVDRSDQLLPREDRDMVEPLMDVLQAEGIDLYLNAVIERVHKIGLQKTVSIGLADGQKRQVTADEIVVALGRRANTDGMGLEAIDVSIERGAIAVDSRLRTAHKHIYAAGDVIGGYQFTHAAGYEGGIIVSNAVFHLPRKADYTYIPWCTYSDPELASIGFNEKRARAAGIDYHVLTEAFHDNDRALAEGAALGQIKLVLDKKDHPLGVQILGARAGDILSEWVAFFNGGLKLSTLASAIHPYPTLGEINKKIAGAYFSPKLFSEKIQKGLKFFFNLKGRACSMESCELE